jgi:hypothetical protein
MKRCNPGVTASIEGVGNHSGAVPAVATSRFGGASALE